MISSPKWRRNSRGRPMPARISLRPLKQSFDGSRPVVLDGFRSRARNVQNGGYARYPHLLRPWIFPSQLLHDEPSASSKGVRHLLPHRHHGPRVLTTGGIEVQDSWFRRRNWSARCGRRRLRRRSQRFSFRPGDEDEGQNQNSRGQYGAKTLPHVHDLSTSLV